MGFTSAIRVVINISDQSKVWAHPSKHSEAALKVYNIKIENEVKINLDNLLTSVEIELSKSSINPVSNTDEEVDFTAEIDLTNEPDTVEIAKKRKRYDFLYKMDIIDQVDSGTLPVDVAINNNLDNSLVSR